VSSPLVFDRLDYLSLDTVEPVANTSRSIGRTGPERDVQLVVGTKITFPNNKMVTNRQQLLHNSFAASSHPLYLCRSMTPRSACGFLPSVPNLVSRRMTGEAVLTAVFHDSENSEMGGADAVDRNKLANSVESGSGKLGNWSAFLYLGIPFPHRYPTPAGCLIR